MYFYRADNAVDTTSINIPRVNCDLVFQEDLYPPVTVVDPTSSSKDWFDKKQSYEPLLVNFNELGKLTWTKSSTMRPLGNPLLNKSTPRLSRKSNASSISELALDTPVPLNLVINNIDVLSIYNYLERRSRNRKKRLVH